MMPPKVSHKHPMKKNTPKQGGRKRVRGTDIMVTEMSNMSKAISTFCGDSKENASTMNKDCLSI